MGYARSRVTPTEDSRGESYYASSSPYVAPPIPGTWVEFRFQAHGLRLDSSKHSGHITWVESRWTPQSIQESNQQTPSGMGHAA
eukprot:354535-Chlamydomonas_euryale.AAC.5